MLSGETLGVVVGNHTEDLDALRGRAQRIAEDRAPEQDLIAEVRQAMLVNRPQ